MITSIHKQTPVVLELGGKSPCIVDDTIDPAIAAKRIAWGKVTNTGQICIAPDYVLVLRKSAPAFIEALKKSFNELVTDQPQKCASYGRIVSLNHYSRLVDMCEKQMQIQGSKLEFGFQHDKNDLYISPTVFSGVKPNDPVMQQEIFGPILPVIVIDSIDEAIKIINTKELCNPLSLYPFSKSKATIEKIFESVNSGHFVANDVLMNATIEGLPFGGVGNSGMGSYHGPHSFNTFTRARGFLHKSAGSEWENEIRYPNKSGDTNSRMYRGMRWLVTEKVPGNTALAMHKLYHGVGGGVAIGVAATFVVGLVIGAHL
jgi:acyl-CoA reductase-like NAD-dependent aldehyde dehydrogenase